MTHTFEIPDERAALDFQRNNQGSWRQYTELSNNCLNYCMRVLNAGEPNLSEGRAAIPWATRLLGGSGGRRR
ncbi:hypothetical protein [Streptomyces sp. NPDC047928]|uniref:hypothetical protein n=1 Tax=unclassified Streptomyces TaxID=2593676 RepID=UPI003711CAE5